MMKELALIERNRKREIRTIYRNKRLEYEQSKRPPSRREKDAREAALNKEIKEIFQADGKRRGKPDKKPGQDEFLKVYSYIPGTAFDLRYHIPSSWKPQSFNKRKQHLEFLKKFVYPYPLPETLLWASHCPEQILDASGKKGKSPDFVYIRLAKKWISDIVSGQSFYRLNRQFFTKAEAHFFLSSKVPYSDPTSILTLYFYAKSRAHSLNHKQSMMIANVFTVKFQNCFRNNYVDGFLELLSKTPQYPYENGMLGDISDFVLSKINEKGSSFSFNGRTITSIIKLTNEWHEEIRREAEAQRIQQEAYWRERNRTGVKERPIDTSHWRGMNIGQFTYVTDDFTWTVTELKTAQDLVNEGRKMKNCVASYAYNCATGDSAIFSLERIYPVGKIIEKVATLEVFPSKRILIQARGKCNSAITPKIESIVVRWGQANGIKVGVLV